MPWSVPLRPLRRTLALSLLLLAVLYAAPGCATTGTNPPPPLPALHALDVQVADVAGPPVPGAVVTILDNQNAGKTATANASGRALLTGLIVPSGFTVCATVEGYEQGCTGVTLIVSSNVTIRLAKATPPPPPVTIGGRVVVSGERFLDLSTGKDFIWRGLTGFRLAELIANGREAEAVEFMAWAQRTGFNVVRVLLMCSLAPDGGMFRLEPEKGRAALPRLLTLAKEHGLYVEVVALAATRRFNFTEAQGRAHLKAVALIVAEHTNAFLQIANEYEDGSQADFIQDVARLSTLSSEIPAVVTYTVSSPNGEHDERDQPQGEYLTRHRSRDRDLWNSARRVVEIARVGGRLKKPIVDDEPTGAGEVETGGSRTGQPAVFYWQGLAARGHGIGSTFHFENGLQAKLPGPKQQACAEAFIAGSRAVPDGVRFAFENAQHSTSPVKGANFDREGPPKHEGTVVRVFSFLAGHHSFTAALGLTGEPAIVWQNGYQPAAVIKDYPRTATTAGFVAWRIAK